MGSILLQIEDEHDCHHIKEYRARGWNDMMTKKRAYKQAILFQASPLSGSSWTARVNPSRAFSTSRACIYISAESFRNLGQKDKKSLHTKHILIQKYDTFNAAAPRANQPSGYKEFKAMAASLRQKQG